MKKIINFISLFILVLFFLTTFLFNVKYVFAISCSQIGNSTYCSDGTSYSQIGNSIYGSDGSNYNQIGNTTYGNDGSSCSGIGNSVYCNDGTNYNKIGNSIYGSDGSNYSQIGNTTYGTGGKVANSCPAHSSYDTLSGKCKCSYGYKSNGVSCVYEVLSYPNIFAIPVTKCPLNSHSSISDTTKCQCDVGYQVNQTKDACIISIKTNDQLCQDSFGLNGTWAGTMNSGGNLNCKCKTGYRWNNKGTACEKDILTTAKENIITTAEDNLNMAKNESSVALPWTNINIRESPSTGDKIVGTAKKGVEYNIVDLTNTNWVKIKFNNGKIGWVARRYVSIKLNNNTEKTANFSGKPKKTQNNSTDSCINSAKLLALIESGNAFNNSISYFPTAPEQCKKYTVDLDMIQQTHPLKTNDGRTVADNYKTILSIYSEQKKLFSDCVYSYVYSQEYAKCLNK